MNKNKNKEKNKRSGRSKILKISIISILVVLIALISGVGIYIYRTIYGVTEAWEEKKPSDIELPPEISDEPVNILLVGADIGDGEREREPLADTIMILRVNPKEENGFLISIPRDTYIEIPGFGKQKINAALAHGGGKIDLLMETVEKFLDIPIHHYVVLNFQGFIKLVDELGGVDIYVEEPLHDELSEADFSVGKHHMNGQDALAYVRCRKIPKGVAYGDIGRIQRQQKFLREMAKQHLNFATLFRAGKLAEILAQYTDSDLNFSELTKYASKALNFKPENFQAVLIPTEPKTIDDQSCQIPLMDEIEVMMDKIKKGESAMKYSAEYDDMGTTPTVMEVGKNYDGVIKLKIKNTGYFTWPCKETEEYNYVAVSYWWIDAETGESAEHPERQRRTPIHWDVEPGVEVELEVNVSPPQKPGKYILQYDMVHEGVDWFSYRGVPTLNKEVEVIPAQ
jgi:LCP family protein required for cell wall assembly